MQKYQTIRVYGRFAIGNECVDSYVNSLNILYSPHGVVCPYVLYIFYAFILYSMMHLEFLIFVVISLESMNPLAVYLKYNHYTIHIMIVQNICTYTIQPF